MKKILLIVMVFGIVFSGFAQKQYMVEHNAKKQKEVIYKAGDSNVPVPVFNTDKAVDEDVDRVFIGKATDYRTVRKEDARVISYNPELDIITVSLVLDPDTYGTNDTDIGMFYSLDRGLTWEGPVVVFDNGDDFVNDFPAGIVYNPEGNTSIDDAYAVMSNISHVGGDWGYKMWASMTMGGENQDIEVSHNDDNIEDGYWNFIGLTQRGEQARCMSMLPTGDWGEYQTAALQPIFGDFEGSNFSWDESELIDMELYQDTEENGTMAWSGSLQTYDAGLGMEWSEDGEIGYIWLNGVSDDEATGFQPLMYMTEDAGDSWDFVEFDFLTDEMQEFFDPYLLECPNEFIIPLFVETTGVVDYNGDLQMFFVGSSHPIDVTIKRDSLNSGFVNDPGDLFKMVVNADGMQDIMWIDSLQANNVNATDEGNYIATEGWQHRISVATNDARNEFFLTWIDTEGAEFTELNVHPDIFGWSTNIDTEAESGVISFTNGTLFETYYFFTYGAEYAHYDAVDDIYTVPYITVVDPTEFSGNGTTDPVSFNFVTGIEFPDLGYHVGVNDINTGSSFSVSQNQPNPFNGSTTISVTTELSKEVVVEVTNIMGQTIYTVNAGTVNGTKEIALNANNLEAGVYFYNVTVGNDKITKKMIVK